MKLQSLYKAQQIREKNADNPYPLQHVISTVSDRAIPQEISSSGNVSFYQADIKSYSDYYPFGMQMPGRFETAAGHNYLYGQGGQEKESEITGSESHYSAEYWMYDSKTARRWNLDPMPNPWQSSYATFNSNPIVFSDPLGLYGTEEEAQQQRKEAIKAGHTVGDVYQSGDEYGFNIIGSDNSTSATFNKTEWGESSNFYAFIGISPSLEKMLKVDTKTAEQKEPVRYDKLIRISVGQTAAVTSLVSLKSCNPSYGQVQDNLTPKLNRLLENSSKKALEEAVTDLKRRHQDELVFRYMSIAEYDATLEGSWRSRNNSTWPTLVNKDKNGNLGLKYVTPDVYFSSQTAKAALALPTAPSIVVWTFKNDLRTLTPRNWKPVDPKYGEPGGGREGTISEPFPIRGAFMLNK